LGNVKGNYYFEHDGIDGKEDLMKVRIWTEFLLLRTVPGGGLL
jgi:hypothetical protein